MSLEVASIMPLASPGLWRMSLPAVFFMDGCQPLPISSVRCHFLVYSHLSLFLSFPPPSLVYLLMNSVSWACFCFPALSQGERVWGFFGGGGGMRTGCYGALVGTLAQRYQGRAGRSAPRSADSLCPPHHASSAICEQCVKRKTDTPFPPRPGRVCLLQRPEKGQRSMGRQRRLYIPSEQWESQIDRAASAPPSSLSIKPSNIFFCGETVLPWHLHPWWSSFAPWGESTHTPFMSFRWKEIAKDRSGALRHSRFIVHVSEPLHVESCWKHRLM